MVPHFTQPEPVGRLDRLGTWMRARKWRQWLGLSMVWLVGGVTVFAAWIGVAILRGSTDRDAGAVALNLVLVVFLSIVGLVAVHGGTYRWFWHVDRKRAEGALRAGDPDPPYGSEPTEPPPRIDWPWPLRLRHALIYLVAIATLLYGFGPYDNQIAIMRFVTAHSAGRSSAGSLNMMLFGFLPLGIMALLAMLLTWRQMQRRDAGLLDARGTLLLEAEVCWLFSFAAAFTVTAFLCRWGGSMIVAYL